ncbi:hypothetical protein ACWGB8_27680 [Kitasatospora sp. NPDC054939]
MAAALSLQAAETPVPGGTVFSEQRRTTVEIGDLTEDIALRLAVYVWTEGNVPV